MNTERESFANRIATRRATQRAEQGVAVIARNRPPDELQAHERALRTEEARLEQAPRQALSYAMARARLARKACPGCERPVDTNDGKTDFCPHCGTPAWPASQRPARTPAQMARNSA